LLLYWTMAVRNQRSEEKAAACRPRRRLRPRQPPGRRRSDRCRAGATFRGWARSDHGWRARSPYRRGRRAHRAAFGSAFLAEREQLTIADGGPGRAQTRSGTPAGSPAHQDELSAPLARCRSAFFSIGVFSGVINILMLTGSFYMLEVYDRVLPSRRVPTLIGLSLLAAGLFVFLGLLDLIRARVLWCQAMHVTACSAIAAGRCVDRPGADRACV
jgi:hypothetical protein